MSGIAQEWRIVSREPFFRIGGIVLLLLTALALWNGLTFAEQRSDEAKAAVERAADRRAADRQVLMDEASGRAPEPRGTRASRRRRSGRRPASRDHWRR
jgi:hypothetical protein